MIALTLAEVSEAVGGRLAPVGRAVGDVVITSVATDSRSTALDGALFVALTTDHGDGHDHVAAALDAGACAAVVAQVPTDVARERPLVVVEDTWRALERLAVAVRRRVDPFTVAVTGSFGKTTTKDLSAAAIGAGRRVIASRASHNNELGVPLTLLALEATTEVLVAEVGARHVGDIAAMAALVEPDVAMVTAVAGVHLEVFGSIEAVARGKRELVESLGPGGTAVLNLDDPRVAAMAAVAPRVLGVSAAAADGRAPAEADVVATAVRLDAGARAVVAARTPWGDTELRLPLPGRHHVVNGLLALAAAGLAGVAPEAAAAGIAGAATSPWRGEVARTAGGATVVNDAYNASPATVRAALGLLLELEGEGRRWAVLGEMAELGDAAPDAHREVGAACAALRIDRLVVVGAGAAIADGALAAGMDPAHVRRVPDAAAAEGLVAAELAPGDVVLVKGSRVARLERVAEGLLGRTVAAG